MAKAKRRPQNKKLKAKQRQKAAKNKDVGQSISDEALMKHLMHALNIHTQGNNADAEEIVKKVLSVSPNNSDAYSLLGIICHNTNRFDKAIECHRKSIEINPAQGNYYSNLGAAMNKAGKPDEAVEAYEEAINLDPHNEQTYFNLAIALRALGRLEESIQCYEKVLAINPDHAEANAKIDSALEIAGREENLLSYNEKVEKISPSHAKARYNKALLNLRLGNLREGFRDYELRWLQKDAHAFPQNLESVPIWNGAGLNGGTLLIYGEQGIGDVVQFIRYVKIIKEKYFVGKICVKCHILLYSLLENVEEIDVLVGAGDDLPEFDAFTPILSLPHIMQTQLHTIPADVPYLKASGDLVAKWKKKLDESTGFKIGIVWAGAINHKNDHNRSCKLSQFESLMDIQGTVFYSLQKGRDEKEIKELASNRSNVFDLANEIEDFADTAAIMETLDLVISVDTSPAHLAGAINIPVWTLLPFVPDWRWLLKREDCPWYPSMKLFRQSEADGWDGVFFQLHKELTNLVEAGGAAVNPETKCDTALLNNALAAHKSGDIKLATDLCMQVITDHPDNADAYSSLGMFAHTAKEYDKSIEYYKKAIAINPDKADYYTNIGAVLEMAEQYPEAADAHRKAIEIDAGVYRYFYNLSLPLHKQGKLEEALSALEKSSELNPQHINSLFVRGNILHDLGRLDEAKRVFGEALELDPNDKRIIYNRSFIYLLQGDLQKGYKDYQTRFAQDELLSLPDFVGDKPMWDGSDLSGKTILIHAEQGFGDVLQFIRYFPMVKALGAKIIAECHVPLLGFLQQVEQVDVWLRDGQGVPHFDTHVPILDLPYHLGTTVENIPADVPYLKASEEKISQWKEKISGRDGYKVGFVWSGREGHHNDHNRSCTLEQFESFMDVSGVTFYSLQKGRDEEKIYELSKRRSNVIDLGSSIKDFSDTAAIVQQMDLIISVDTAVVHMAGALGKEVWTLLPYVPDWRWLLERGDSPWYPTMKLFRQKGRKEWGEVFADVKEKLVDLVGNEISSEETSIIEIEVEAVEENIVDAFRSFQKNDFETARKICLNIIESEKNNAEAYNLISVIEQKLEHNEEAVKYLKEAVEIDPNNESFWSNLCSLYRKMDQPAESLSAAKEVLKLNSGNVDANYNAGFALYEMDSFEEALVYFKDTIVLSPKHYNSMVMAASVEQKLCHLDEATKYYNKAIELKPDDSESIYNRSLIMLLQGDLAGGFAGYDSRWSAKQDRNLPDVIKNVQMWQGEDISGKKLFLHTEQGFGDALQFIRFVPEIKKFDAKIIVGCKRELCNLMSAIYPDAVWVPEGDVVQEFDLHCPVMSLPRVLGTTLETIPVNIPYIKACEESINKWAKDINHDTFNVGIVWSGNPKFPDNKNRSCPLEYYEEFMDIPGVTFYSLQKGSQEEEISDLCDSRDNVFDMGNKVRDFSDTSAILSKMDLLISTDTSVPHLAGAMGVRTWLLASFVPDWRWLLERDDSPWYPTMRLFRQLEPGGWDDVVRKVRTELEDLIKNEA